MKIIETTFERLPRERLVIGFEGENLRATVRIDCASVFAEYPNATPALIVKPLFADAYPVVVDRNGTDVDWLITSEILSFSGDGEIQLVFYKGEVICKSAVSKIRVSRSLTVTGEMPDPVVQWIENANRKLAEVDAQIVELEGMVDTATDAATRAEQSASTASAKAEQAAGSAATASTKAAEAQASANTATAKASEAALSATQANNSAVSAADSERGATAKAGEATTAATTATAKAEQATEAARTATEKAGDASASARAAHASEISAAESADDALSAEVGANAAKRAAEASATQAGTSEQNAGTAAQTATQKAAEATQSATDADASATNAATSAETASTKAGEAAQSAQTVEQTAEQLAESLEQISQNTADIAEHEQEYNALKEATLIHNTASGAIASFTDGSEMPVDEVTAQINPVQDLHGYSNPWPGGGGVNLFDIDNITSVSYAYGLTTNIDGDVVRISGTYTGSGSSSYRIIYHNQPIIQGAKFAIFRLDTSSASTSLRYASTSDNAIVVELKNLTQNTDVDVRFRFVMYTGTTVPTAYSPYSNICPISGHTGMTVTRTGKNLYDISRHTVTSMNTFLGVSPKPNTDYVFSTDKAITGLYVEYSDDETMPSQSKNTGWTSLKTVYNNTFLSFNSGSHKWLRLMTYESGGMKEHTLQLELGTNPTAYEPYSGETYEVEFPTEAGTVYGGSLTIAEDGSGVLTVDMAMVDLGTLTWYKIATAGSHWRFWAYLNDMAYGGEMLSSQYKHITASQSYMGEIGVASQSSGSNYLAMVTDERFSDTDTFKTAMSGVQLVYELAEPITYTLTAPEITTLLGENNLWHDANGDISVGYKANTKLYIDGKIAELVARIVNS